MPRRPRGRGRPVVSRPGVRKPKRNFTNDVIRNAWNDRLTTAQNYKAMGLVVDLNDHDAIFGTGKQDPVPVTFEGTLFWGLLV
jgi:hypothetical protein